MKFAYVIDLEEGYMPLHEWEMEKRIDEVRVVIEAPNRVTADRMIKAVLQKSPNVKEYDGTCIEHSY